MERNYLDVTDDQVIEKTGRRISEWIKILDEFQASKKRSNDTVTHLHQAYGVLTHRAKALITYYLKQKKYHNDFGKHPDKTRANFLSGEG